MRRIVITDLLTAGSVGVETRQDEIASQTRPASDWSDPVLVRSLIMERE